jgi:anti-sigma-K factor RskA
MIDERHEELATLYALDLLEGAERASFEAELARSPELQGLVRELREATAALTHSAPAATPPEALKARVLSTISALPSPAAEQAEIIRPPLSIFRQVMPWAVAACFALFSAYLGQQYLSTRSELILQTQKEQVTALALRSTEQQLAAERIVVGAQLQKTDKELADTRGLVAQRDGQLASLTQRIDTLTGATTQLGRELGDEKQKVATAQERITDLVDRLRLESDIANLKITALASRLDNSPEALAIAVWNPLKQEGILKVEKLPALDAGKDYQLWIVDPQYKDPVDGGVFTVDPVTGEARISFKSKQPVKSIGAFAVTLERKGGVPKAEGPFVLLGTK